MKKSILKNYFLLLTFLFIGNLLNAQDTYQRNTSADVQSYIFNLSLNDDNNEIKGEAELAVDFKNEVSEFALDLIAKSETYGMEITGVFEDSTKANYTYENNKIKKHEHTMPEIELERTNLCDTQCANAGPVFYSFNGGEDIVKKVNEIVASEPYGKVETKDKVVHCLWK